MDHPEHAIFLIKLSKSSFFHYFVKLEQIKKLAIIKEMTIDLNSEAIILIQNALKTDRNLQLLISLIGLGMGGYLLINNLERFTWIVNTLILAVIFGCFKLLYDVIRFWQPRQMPLIQLLINQPKEIIWVYSVLTEKLPLGIWFSKKGTMYFKLMNKDEFTIKLSEKEALIVSKYLNDRLPHATFGYSKDKEQWYMANPALLINDSYQED